MTILYDYTLMHFAIESMSKNEIKLKLNGIQREK